MVPYTAYVLDRDTAVRFYADVLRLELTNRFGPTGRRCRPERHFSTSCTLVGQVPAAGTRGTVKIGPSFRATIRTVGQGPRGVFGVA